MRPGETVVESHEAETQAKQDTQLMLEPPPRHWPHGTTGARPPSAALSRPTLNLTVVLSGRR